VRIRALQYLYGICRFGPNDPAPSWVTGGEFVSVTRTSEELSVVCPQRAIPESVPSNPDWRVLQVEGPLDFSLVGILAGLSATLAQANISLFAVSTFDTDYLLVHEADFKTAVKALRGAGHEVAGD